MNKKWIILSGLILIMAVASSISFSLNYVTVKYEASDPITVEKMRMLPVPFDFRNYFFLQSIDDDTNIVIGDFVGSEKLFCLITDKNSDGTIDKITEYMPDSDKYTNQTSPTTGFFTSLPEVKEGILNGEIFKNNYSYNVTSLPALKGLLKRGKDIIKTRYGFTVKLYDPDNPSTIMSEFYFNKNLAGRYDLVFIMHFYKIFKTVVVPPVTCFVYCRNSKDPLIAETVESLLRMAPVGIVPGK